MNEKLSTYIHKGSVGITHAVLVCLGIGLLLETIGGLTGFAVLVSIGMAAKLLFIPAIGGMIAYQLGANPLTIVSAMGAAVIGGNALKPVESGVILTLGEPVGAILAAVIATYFSKKVAGKSRFDMMSIPLTALLTGGLSGYALSFVISPLLTTVSGAIAASVTGFPILGSITIAVVWGLLIISPASSAALAIALQLDPVSSAAALIGCTIQFTAFAVMSRRENDMGAVIAQFICTPKLQLPNIIKKPLLLIPPALATIVCAPIATVIGGLVAPNTVAGLGLCALIAPLNILENQGIEMLGVYVVTGILLPAVLIMIIASFMRKKGYIQQGDMVLEIN